MEVKNMSEIRKQKTIDDLMKIYNEFESTEETPEIILFTLMSG
jgi:hypothetical protein